MDFSGCKSITVEISCGWDQFHQWKMNTLGNGRQPISFSLCVHFLICKRWVLSLESLAECNRICTGVNEGKMSPITLGFKISKGITAGLLWPFILSNDQLTVHFVEEFLYFHGKHSPLICSQVTTTASFSFCRDTAPFQLNVPFAKD